MNRCRCKCSARLLEDTAESNSEFANACRRPCGKNNACAWTPYMVENRSTGGLAPPAVPPAPVSDREQPLRFALAGCSVGVGVLNLKLPPLGIPPREPGGGCQKQNQYYNIDTSQSAIDIQKFLINCLPAFVRILSGWN